MESTASLLEQLPSWRAGRTREALVDFLLRSTNGETAVPVAARIAAFDNDGTMACEKPQTSIAAFASRISGESAGPLAALADGERRASPGLGPGAEDRLAELTKGWTVQQFDATASRFLSEDRHPRWGLTWPDLVYAPMRELLDVLLRIDFTVFLVSGSSRDFLRAMAQTAYGLTREHIVGTEVDVDYRDGRLVRTATVHDVDLGAGKPSHLWDRSGGVPLLAAGNAHTDIDMLDMARFALVVDHDDPVREYAYADDEIRRTAEDRGWTVASVRDDFGVVFGGRSRLTDP